MEIVKDENAQHEGEATPPTETNPAGEQTTEKETSRNTIIIEVVCYDTGRQEIGVTTPPTFQLSENIGMLEIAKAIILKKL